MAKLQMQKIEIIALIKDSQSIVERLQRRGVVELTNVTDERFVKLNTDTNIAQYERDISNAIDAMKCIDRYCNRKSPMLGFLTGRKTVTTSQFAKSKERTDKTIFVCNTVLEAVRKITELENNISKEQTQIDVLTPWESLKLPLNFKGTKTTRSFIGTFPGAIDKDSVCEDADIEIISSRKEQICAVVTCLKENAEGVLSIIRDMGFMQVSGGGKTPAEEIASLNESIKNEKDKIIKNEYKIKSYADERENIEFLIDFLTMRKAKYESISKLGMTKNTVIISGYIPEKYADGLVEEFEKKYEIAINITETDEEDDVPVLLKNGPFSEPVEGITKMYALPGKRDVDPSAVMAFFYYLFFGMMLSDAGYGALMVIFTAIVLTKFSVEGSMRKTMKMYFYCGISTLFWGALFGSWFGDLPQVIASNFFGQDIGSTALWFEPLDDPIKLLLFSFALGIAHLFLGLAVNMSMLWKEGKRVDAICEVVPVYLTVLGVAPMGAGLFISVPPILSEIGKYLLIFGVISIVLTAGRSSKNIFMRFFGGIYGLYNIATGYLSDILSYSRLLALGLATGSIASVINLIAVMPDNTVVKAILLVVVGLIGHTANMGINLLGAYVHSDRLQFVELFSKFYEGGGRPFKPLNAETKYIKFEKENIYE